MNMNMNNNTINNKSYVTTSMPENTLGLEKHVKHIFL
jgi:hypothetical protein